MLFDLSGIRMPGRSDPPAGPGACLDIFYCAPVIIRDDLVAQRDGWLAGYDPIPRPRAAAAAISGIGDLLRQRRDEKTSSGRNAG
jgi:hypothetical protein